MMPDRSSFISLAIIIGAFLMMAMLDQYGRHVRIYGRASGPISDPGVEKAIVSTPVEAYHYWQGRGFKGREIIFIADKWDRFDPREYDEASYYKSYPLSLYNLPKEQEKKFLDDKNFLYMASINGIVRQIHALLSESGYREAKIHAQQAKDVKFDGGDIYQPFLGFPRYYTNGRSFRDEKEPVLIYVSASYFKEMSPDILFHLLSDSGLITDSIVLCNSLGDNTVSNVERDKLKRFAGLIVAAREQRQWSTFNVSAGEGHKS